MDWIVSLTPEAAAEPLAALAKPPAGASIVELRLDLMPGLDLRAAVAACPLPVLATLRSEAEGGRGPVDPTARRSALEAARDAGAALIDLEQARDALLGRELGLPPEQTVLSWHDPHGTPGELAPIAERLLASTARWVKIVPTARSLADLEAVLALHARCNTGPRARRRLIAFAMGAPGLASRYLAPLLGPPLSFAAWREGAAAAPGQLGVGRLEAAIAHLNGPPQRLYGVVGADVSASLSPALHGAAARGLALPFLMVPLSVSDPAELGELFAPAGATCFDRVGLAAHGWAVTTPYKAAAAQAATLRAPRVRRAGAANTLILKPAQVVAENTDADGVVGSLASLDLDPRGRTAVVQGTGGAARGAAVGLHLAGATVLLRGRDARRAGSTAAALGMASLAPDAPAPKAAILVNATPLGRAEGEPTPFADSEVAAAAAVVDMVYGDQPTPLARCAGEHGVPLADGREVLLHQGIAQFAAFAQTVPPKDAMRAAIRR
ncbi:MAG: type I 3-dehydroquinate dehydratase [Thermoanaerobaculales bacterium]|nr:type I 3-dehydroquinate dehydratase [Thermoanaerobaculales bacterium]